MIGIIGFGRFGKLTARYLARDFDVFVCDSGRNKSRIDETGAAAVSLKEACRQKVVVLCIPISAFEQKLVEIAPLLGEGTLVVDVCSVKVYPVQVMRKVLPQSVSILATHPMFGPDSAADSLEGRKMVLFPVRIQPDCFQRVKSFLASKRLHLIEISPEEHDEQIAVTLALTHFIGRSLSRFGARQQPIDTEGYRRLLHVLEVVGNDTWQLFEDMNRFNPFAAKFRSEFMAAAGALNEQLNEKRK